MYCYVECRYAECHYAECHYAECRSANKLAYCYDQGIAGNVPGHNLQNCLHLHMPTISQNLGKKFYRIEC